MAERPSASIVVLAWNAWQHTRTCLESLRPTLGLHDEVIVVDNGSTDATPEGLRRAGWTKVITNDENRGFAAGCNQGAAVATGEVVVFLNNDTVPVGRWLDELLAPFSDQSVVATGPRSNCVDGPQKVPSMPYTTRSELRAFERTWRMDHGGRTEDIGRLVGFCLAIRLGDFNSIGGFDESYDVGSYEDDDLCRRLRDTGGRLLIAHGSYVHHVGHASFTANGLDWEEIELQNRRQFLGTRDGGPLVSACIIAKDEAEVLGRCLDSLAGMADEVVVGDTGSTDATVDVAASHGAKVVTVAWNDHFAEARNVVLEHCSGRWILWLDADEEWVGDTRAVRELLEMDPPEDGMQVTIDNLMGQGVTAIRSFPAVRIFRQGLRWEGRIHEQVVRPDGRPTLASLFEAAGILHHGYTDQMMTDRNKLERNLHLATLALDEATGSSLRGRALLDLGRTLSLAGRSEEALVNLEAAATEAPDPVTARQAMQMAARTALGAGQRDRAAARIADLRRASTNPLAADLLTAEMACHARMYDKAIELFGRLELPAMDEDHFLHHPSEISHIVALCHRMLGRPDLALDAMLETLVSEGVCQDHLGTLAHDARVAGVNPAQIGAALPPRSMRIFLAQLLHLEADDALAILEGAWERHPGDMAVLATAGTVAPQASPQAVLPWALRLRERGIAPCPLLTIASDPERPLLQALLAAASAAKVFSDEEAMRLIEQLTARVTSAELAQARETLQALAPTYLNLLPATEPTRRGSRALLATIVVPCWNRAAWTLRCLQSLQATLDPGAYELVLVDNGSTDATARVTSNPEAGVVVLRNDTNLGFAVACNQGARAAASDVVVFCNNDVVAKPGWLPPLLAALKNPRVGIVGPKLLFPDGSIQHAGVGLLYDANGEGYLDGFHLLYRQPGSHPAGTRPREVRAVTGAVMAVRREAFLSLGGFDECYWNGNEDVDLCLKFGKEGWLVRYEPASVLVHQESVSGSERFREVDANRARLTARWTGQVLDERVTSGVVVAAPFGRGDTADLVGRALVGLAEKTGVPVVTRSWGTFDPASPTGHPESWPHRLGPPQPVVLTPLEGEEAGRAMEEEREWLLENAKVLAGLDELTGAGLLEGVQGTARAPAIARDAAEAMQELAGGPKRATYSSWRVAGADHASGPRTGQTS